MADTQVAGPAPPPGSGVLKDDFEVEVYEARSINQADDEPIATEDLDLGKPEGPLGSLETTVAVLEVVDKREIRYEESYSSDSSVTSFASRKRIRRHRRRRSSSQRQARPAMTPESKLVRKNGVVYVEDRYFSESVRGVINGHILVSSEYSEKTVVRATGTVSSDVEVSQSIAPLAAPARKADYLQNTPLPPRLTIKNEFLIEEMRKIMGYGRVNYDQAAPFRSIIPFEQEFRTRHDQLEEEFAEMARRQPDHPAVQRKADYLPKRFDYLARERGDIVVEVLDLCDQTRILLDGFRALIHVLNVDLAPLVQTYRQIRDGTLEKLPFSHLWFLFGPGQEVVAKQPKYQAWRVLEVNGGRRSISQREGTSGPQVKTLSNLVIDCFALDYNGKEFGPVPFTHSIKPYEGTRKITDLPVYPLAFDKSTVTVVENKQKVSRSVAEYLMARGKKFGELVQVSHRRYKGFTLREGEVFDTIEEVDSDVMVDFELAYRNVQRKIPLPRFGGGVIVSPTEEDPAEISGEGFYYDDRSFIAALWTKWTQNSHLLRNQMPGNLSEDSYALLPNRVYGYVLLSRKWYPLDIDLIEPVSKVQPGVNDGFGKLVLPSGHKEIVRALINTHARKLDADGAVLESHREFDVVSGKGRGLIILLHGAPGVGKTSTAECVAANAGKPLFPITCGDIGGDTAQEVEDNLEKFFDLARKWNCVLLLDEADVFLSAREAGNITQNSLVSVFLRVLEYYPGILVLTTNRVGSFDEAIKSRVHCPLYYPKLNEERTFEVWKMNIAALDERNADLKERQRVKFDPKEIEEYAKTHWKQGKREYRWNGRQIKNAFQTAVALADWDNLEKNGANSQTGPTLTAEHFKKVAKASKHFDKYLTRTRHDDDFNAKELGLRDDEGSHGPDTDSEPDAAEVEESRVKVRSPSKKKGKKKPSKEKKSKTDKAKSKSKKKKKEKRHETSSSSSSSSSEDSEESADSVSDSSSSEESDDEEGKVSWNSKASKGELQTSPKKKSRKTSKD